MESRKIVLSTVAALVLSIVFAACTAPSTNTAANVSNRSVNAVSNGNAAPANSAAH